MPADRRHRAPPAGAEGAGAMERDKMAYRAIALGTTNFYGQMRESAGYEKPPLMGKTLEEAVQAARDYYRLGRISDPVPRVVEISGSGRSYLVYHDAVLKVRR